MKRLKYILGVLLIVGVIGVGTNAWGFTLVERVLAQGAAQLMVETNQLIRPYYIDKSGLQRDFTHTMMNLATAHGANFLRQKVVNEEIYVALINVEEGSGMELGALPSGSVDIVAKIHIGTLRLNLEEKEALRTDLEGENFTVFEIDSCSDPIWIGGEAKCFCTHGGRWYYDPETGVCKLVPSQEEPGPR